MPEFTESFWSNYCPKCRKTVDESHNSTGKCDLCENLLISKKMAYQIMPDFQGLKLAFANN